MICIALGMVLLFIGTTTLVELFTVLTEDLE